jgi:hypothetical protein
MTVDIKKAEQDLKEKLAKAEQEKVDLIKQQEEALKKVKDAEQKVQ